MMFFTIGAITFEVAPFLRLFINPPPLFMLPPS
nr:MAG TPA: hypothetical protein [Caudoviricetes sp.]